ncbi:unnamed protein product [Rangifer tarandus platyrhynchus]|uniref:Uncharacterized protein n=2 Tax=Rangifer tarandus platyrhynchus TaxID=3082113 RepID=A0ABN8YJR6_RANTA|nr:unnamed protein product [Rangifer tarandus platyrhynchus]
MFSIVAAPIYTPTSSAQGSLFSIFSPVLNLLKCVNFLKDHLGYSVDHRLKGDTKSCKETSSGGCCNNPRERWMWIRLRQWRKIDDFQRYLEVNLTGFGY